MNIAPTKPNKPAYLDEFLAHCQHRTYQARSTIINAGAEQDTLYYLIQGSVAVTIEESDDREMIMAYLNTGDFFGEMGLFAEFDGVRTAFIKAKTECEVAEISYSSFQTLVNKDPNLLFHVFRQIANRLSQTTRKAGDLAFLDVTGRIARSLLELGKQPDAMTHPAGMQIKVTRQDIGRMVGCSREMAGRVLKELEEQGLVSVSGKTIVLLGQRRPALA